MYVDPCGGVQEVAAHAEIHALAGREVQGAFGQVPVVVLGVRADDQDDQDGHEEVLRGFRVDLRDGRGVALVVHAGDLVATDQDGRVEVQDVQEEGVLAGSGLRGDQHGVLVVAHRDEEVLSAEDAANRPWPSSADSRRGDPTPPRVPRRRS